MKEIIDVNEEMETLEEAIFNEMDLAYVLRRNLSSSKNIFHLTALRTTLDNSLKLIEKYKEHVEKQIKEYEEQENREKQSQSGYYDDLVIGFLSIIVFIIGVGVMIALI